MKVEDFREMYLRKMYFGLLVVSTIQKISTYI